MKNQTSIFLPRNVGGLICCLAKSSDGGAEVVAWNGKSWVPANIPAGDVVAAPVASDHHLAELGIAMIGTGETMAEEKQPREVVDLEEAEDRGLKRLFARRRNQT